jgi:riboflavin kinase/FMN adenylyltransferase
MRILRHHRNLSPEARGAVVALGNFDGVHRGHQALIGEAKHIASAAGKQLAAVVFEPQPQEFFRPQAAPFRLTPFRAKAHLLSQLGVDILIVLHFERELAAMSAQDFVLEVLKKELAAAHVVVGADFRFGKGRAGDASVLSYMGEMEGFGVTIFAPVAAGGAEKISSTRIREALKAGKPEEAARLLGHWWTVEGHVAAGDGRGRGLGYSTANLKLEHTLEPAFGIYAVRATVDETHKFDGVASFGIRPMFEVKKPLLEVHLFDFAGDLYGKHLAVQFIAYLRPEQKFESLDALKAQMAKDAAEAKRILADADVLLKDKRNGLPP